MGRGFGRRVAMFLSRYREVWMNNLSLNFLGRRGPGLGFWIFGGQKYLVSLIRLLRSKFSTFWHLGGPIP